jgi:radical SAM superfamily enzyme YgiQ (UPF0313 family)
MRVLLVYANPTRDLAPAPPLGLSYVASATRAAGHETRLLDLALRDDAEAGLRAALRDSAPEVIGFSVRNIDNVMHQRLERQLSETARLVAAAREACPGAQIVAGGAAISILGEAALQPLGVDWIVRGEGEAAFLALLAALERGENPGAIPGVQGRAPQPPAERAPSLHHFGPSGMQQWIDWSGYEKLGGCWPIQTRRGCPMQCSYCAYPVLEGAGLRFRPPGEVVDEIEAVIAAVGPRAFEFVDSTFNVPEEPAKALCREIIRRGVKARFTTMGFNPLGASAALFDLMREAGFHAVMITPESASDVMLKNLRKGFTRAQVEKAARLARDSSISRAWVFMLGGPGETRETVEETVSFAERELGGKNSVVIFVTGIRILPGTELAGQAMEEGHLPCDWNPAEPSFYFSKEVTEAEMLARVNQAIAGHPHILHMAEEGATKDSRRLNERLHRLGVAPPFWRFLPWLFRSRRVATFRKRYPMFTGEPAPALARTRKPVVTGA